jgi:hypothetical protein
MLHKRWRMALRSRLAGAGAKPPAAAEVKSQCGERVGQGGQTACQVGTKKTNASEPLKTCRKRRDDVKTGASRYPGSSLGETCLLPRWRPA